MMSVCGEVESERQVHPHVKTLRAASLYSEQFNKLETPFYDRYTNQGLFEEKFYSVKNIHEKQLSCIERT